MGIHRAPEAGRDQTLFCQGVNVMNLGVMVLDPWWGHGRICRQRDTPALGAKAIALRRPPPHGLPLCTELTPARVKAKGNCWKILEAREKSPPWRSAEEQTGGRKTMFSVSYPRRIDPMGFPWGLDDSWARMAPGWT